VFNISPNAGPTAWTISSQKAPPRNGDRFPHQKIYGIAKELGILFLMLYIF
jgi:hypothetical protein